ncbi:sulfite exporter TauE/SafE family protein [Qipengyuania spongiae]|uniref:Probable membrane transporter protein n=1 Tax=Qipengyuania spongiae TaxID=2909673 RepID=A0ABY5SZ29_9SPHN|nr:sulfite exporter TauE/SafE family protein [Qipengyuania spongiae]UVI39116.1 sulfite exporter TauE/SafE family protein [Qipengyuania spongiae]
MFWLVAAFLLTALLYASVGFGGGSTYSALLALGGVDYRILPLLSLSCNIVVVAGATVRFARAKITPWRDAALLIAVAAPAAFLGGLTPIDREPFLLLLGASLVLTGGTLLLPRKQKAEDGERGRFARYVPFVAVPLGYLAGLVGIGGGIFLAPVLHLVRWHGARAIAATASLFILVNSLAGLGGQLLKGGEGRFAAAFEMGLPLLVAVAIGGQIGSLLAVRFLPLNWIRWLTAALTLWVGGRLLIGV